LAITNVHVQHSVWTIRQQTNSQSVKSWTGQLMDSKFFKSQKDYTIYMLNLTLTLMPIESVQ